MTKIKVKKQSLVIQEDWITTMRLMPKEAIIEFLQTGIKIMNDESYEVRHDETKILLETAEKVMLANKANRKSQADSAKKALMNNPKYLKSLKNKPTSDPLMDPFTGKNNPLMDPQVSGVDVDVDVDVDEEGDGRGNVEVNVNEICRMLEINVTEWNSISPGKKRQYIESYNYWKKK